MLITASAVLAAVLLAGSLHTAASPPAADMAVTAAPATMVSQVTGQASPNDTSANYRMSSGDLGIMWSGGAGSVDIAFGDSFGAGGGDWRCNLLAKSTTAVANLSAGLGITTMITDRAGHAKSMLPCPATGSGQSLIPTGGVHIGAADYLSFMFVTTWAPWTTSYAGVAESTDGGQTWSAPTASRWANAPGVGDKFQMTALADADGFLYRYGTPTGRLGSAYLSRVPDDGNVMTPGAYTYWNGESWTSSEADAVPIVGAPVGELSVMDDPSIGKWLMTYLDTKVQAIVLRSAPSPTGPWGTEHILASSQAPGLAGLYGGFMHPWSSGNDLYFTVSLSGPYEVYLMHSSLTLTPTASAALLVSDQQKDYFGQGPDGHLHRWVWTADRGVQDEDWGGDLAGTPTAFLDGSEVEVFGRGSDGHLHRWSWTAGKEVRIQDWGGNLAGTPTAFLNGTEQEVFGRGSDGHLHRWAWNSGLGKGDYIVEDWGENLAGAPTAFLVGSVVEVFGRGLDGHLHHWAWNPSTGSDARTTDSWGGDLAGDPSGYVDGSEVEVFGQGPDGHLHHWFWTASKGVQIQDWGGDIVGTPTAFLNGNEQEVFGRGSDGHLHHWFWNAGLADSGSVVEDWGGDLAGDPAGFFFAAGNQSDVYGRGSDGRLHLWSRNQGAGGGVPQIQDWG